MTLVVREEGGATTDQHWVDPDPVLVDEARRGRLTGEGGTADRDVPVPRLGSLPPDLLRHIASGQPSVALKLAPGGAVDVVQIDIDTYGMG